MEQFWFVDQPFESIGIIKALAETTGAAVQIFNDAGNCVFVNETFTTKLGAPAADYCLFHDVRIAKENGFPLIKRAFEGETVRFLQRWFGGPLAIETTLTPVNDSKGRLRFLVATYKIPDSKFELLKDHAFTIKERDDARVFVQSILDQTRAVIYIKDPDGRYVLVNGQFCRIFNMTEDQILGKTDFELFPKDKAEVFRRNDLHVLSTDTHLEAEETAIHHDGTAHDYISLKFPLRDSEGHLYGLCGISTDIMALRRLERELGTAKRMEAVGLLAGGIAHDFHNGLAIIQLFADKLLMDGAGMRREWKSSIESIKSAAQSAGLLTRQLLTYGRKQSFEPRKINIGTVILDLKGLLPNALGEDIEYTAEIAPELWNVIADPLQIEQVITNLCFNARDAMPTGGALTVRLQNKHLGPDSAGWRSSMPIGEFVELSVTDSGVGIPKDDLDRIFEPFFTTKNEIHGTGLGLSTVYEIVRGAGGKIIVDSEVGHGTVFRVFWPRDAQPAVEVKDARIHHLNFSGGDETIMLVEDQEILRGVTASLLRNWGYTVIEATDSKQALEMWETIAEQVDLVMTDIVMPGINGLEMSQKMSESLNQKPVKTLFVSAYSGKRLSDYGFDSENYHVLHKPYSADGLLVKIRELLN